jgi:hypothetical protein
MTPCRCETADFSKDSPTFIFMGYRVFLRTDYFWTRKQAEILKREDHSVNCTVSLSSRLECSVTPVEKLTPCMRIILNASMTTAQPTVGGGGGWGENAIDCGWKKGRFLLFGGGVINDPGVNNVLGWWPRYLKVFHCVSVARWQQPGRCGHVTNSLPAW